MAERATALDLLMSQVCDPETDSFESILSLGLAAEEVIEDSTSRIRRVLTETYRVVGGLVEGSSAGLFRKHVSLTSLPSFPDATFSHYYKSPEEVGQEEVEHFALHLASEASVLYVAERQSPSKGVKTIDTHSTVIGRPALRAAFDTSVLKAINPESLDESAEIIDNCASKDSTAALQLTAGTRGLNYAQEKIQTLEAVLSDIDSAPLHLRLVCLGMRSWRRYDLGQYKQDVEKYKVNLASLRALKNN